jgi:hypothetical protein
MPLTYQVSGICFWECSSTALFLIAQIIDKPDKSCYFSHIRVHTVTDQMGPTMIIWLVTGALTMAILAGLHSYIGETRLLQPLIALPDLPILLGTTDYTRSVLRWAWHLTSLAWLGFAAIFIALTQIPEAARPLIGIVLAGFLGLSAIIAFMATRGRHLAWLFFLIATVCAWWGTR